MTENRPETYSLTESTQFTQTGASACNYRIIEVPAGEYPIQWIDISGNEVNPDVAYYGRIALPGVIVDGREVNRLFGSISVRPDPFIGQPETYYIRRYAYKFGEVTRVDA